MVVLCANAKRRNLTQSCPVLRRGSTRLTLNARTSLVRRLGARVAVFMATSVIYTSSVSGGTTDDAPFHCYLTWQNDPTSTLTLNFHTVGAHESPEVRFDVVSRDGSPAAYTYSVEARTHTIPGLDAFDGAQRYIHVAEMTGLTPDRVYYFIVGSQDGGYTPQQSVRLPSRDINDLIFVAGGDMSTTAAVPGLLSAAAAESPRFAVIGGDIAYEDGRLENWPLWDQWLSDWQTFMITPEGHSVPMILAIGNHEVFGGYQQYDDAFGRGPV